MAEHAAAPAGQLTEPADSAVAQPRSPIRLAAVAGLVTALVLGGVAGWLGFRYYESDQAQRQREAFLQSARQTAINLTTIDWRHADADIERVLNGATGTFHDDFASRAQPFVDVVKQAQSTSEGKIIEAGLESVTPQGAQAVVAVGVNTQSAGGPKAEFRAWRMRISVQRVGDEVKVSNVQFVS